MSEETLAQQNQPEHNMHEVIAHAKRNLKAMTEKQTELEKGNLEYQGIKDRLMQLLDISAEELTPQEFSELLNLVDKSQVIIDKKNLNKEESK